MTMTSSNHGGMMAGMMMIMVSPACHDGNHDDDDLWQSWCPWHFMRVIMVSLAAEMEKVGDTGDISAIFFSWCLFLGHFGNFGSFLGQIGQFWVIFGLLWVILGHFWATFWF